MTDQTKRAADLYRPTARTGRLHDDHVRLAGALFDGDWIIETAVLA